MTFLSLETPILNNEDLLFWGLGRTFACYVSGPKTDFVQFEYQGLHGNRELLSKPHFCFAFIFFF